MKKIKNLFIDFNGTLLDDVNLCLDLLNLFLKEQNKPLIELNIYKHIFTFPIYDYYILAGLDFKNESFDSMANRFIKRYKAKSPNCKLYDDIITTLEYLKSLNIKLIILSASEKNMLIDQLKYYDIYKYFDDILGINDFHAKSKEQIGVDYINKKKLNLEECLFIGDTIHDYEVASKMGVRSVLVSTGHQSKDILMQCGVDIIDSFSNIKEYL